MGSKRAQHAQKKKLIGRKCRVAFDDGVKYFGDIVGYDPTQDLYVFSSSPLRVSTPDVPPAPCHVRMSRCSVFRADWCTFGCGCPKLGLVFN